LNLPLADGRKTEGAGGEEPRANEGLPLAPEPKKEKLGLVPLPPLLLVPNENESDGSGFVPNEKGLAAAGTLNAGKAPWAVGLPFGNVNELPMGAAVTGTSTGAAASATCAVVGEAVVAALVSSAATPLGEAGEVGEADEGLEDQENDGINRFVDVEGAALGCGNKFVSVLGGLRSAPDTSFLKMGRLNTGRAWEGK
jgi:hypothetical protein